MTHALCLILLKIGSSLRQVAVNYKKPYEHTSLDGAAHHVHLPGVQQQQITSQKHHTASTAPTDLHHLH